MFLRPCLLLPFGLVALVLTAAPGQAQNSDLGRGLTCAEPWAAQRETQLLEAIAQARSERAGNTVSLGEALRSVTGMMPGGAGGAEMANLLSRLEMALALFGGAEALQGMDFGEVAVVMGPLRDRLAPLFRRNLNAEDPLAMMQVAMAAVTEIRQLQTERARVAPNRLEGLQQELRALQQQCRGAATPATGPQRQAPSPGPTAPPLPTPEPTVTARNVFGEACDRQGGSAITYYEGQPTTAGGELVYEQVLECLPGSTPLGAETLQAACDQLQGRFDSAPPNPTCRLDAAVPQL